MRKVFEKKYVAYCIKHKIYLKKNVARRAMRLHHS